MARPTSNSRAGWRHTRPKGGLLGYELQAAEGGLGFRAWGGLEREVQIRADDDAFEFAHNDAAGFRGFTGDVKILKHRLALQHDAEDALPGCQVFRLTEVQTHRVRQRRVIDFEQWFLRGSDRHFAFFDSLLFTADLVILVI